MTTTTTATDATTIRYPYVQDTQEIWGEWTGSREAAIREGRRALDDDSPDHHVSDAAAAVLGAALLDGRPINEIWSIWWSGYGYD